MDITEHARRIYETKKRLLELMTRIRSQYDGIRGRWLSKEELLAQMTAIVLAATDTTSSALTRILHLLALHPDIQNSSEKS
ncbi:hypothetical protein EDB87DRAFT_1099609 [Lactarius vividus]|nr:hypothetical protein EDB87DRAFT_1099609 [Lactarius vividus]